MRGGAIKKVLQHLKKTLTFILKYAPKVVGGHKSSDPLVRFFYYECESHKSKLNFYIWQQNHFYTNNNTALLLFVKAKKTKKRSLKNYRKKD